MAFLYALWMEQPTNSAKLTMLNKFIGELQQRTGPELTSGDKARSSYALTRQIDTLLKAAENLQRIVDMESDSTGGRGRMVLTP